MNIRDPRIEPQAGDVLRKGKFDRKVLACDGDGTITYRAECLCCIAIRHISAWRLWAKDAEVIR